MQTHDTFVIGYKNNIIEFLQSFTYELQKDEAQKALKYVQDETLFDGWRIGAITNWTLQHNYDSEIIPVRLRGKQTDWGNPR